jgi:hypothetical protein
VLPGVDLLTELPELSERGSVSAIARRPSISSSSSMEGNAWENSTGVRKDVRGDEEAEDVGDGGPKAEGDTNEWTEGGGLETLDDEDVLWVIVGDDNPRDCRELRIARVLSEVVVVIVGERGIDKEGGISLETRLVVLTDKPASCNDRILSAMDPPDTFCTPFSRGGEGWWCPLSLEKIGEENRRRGDVDLLSGGRPFHLRQSAFYGMCTLHKVATLSLKSG